jgi:hypothetical protein
MIGLCSKNGFAQLTFRFVPILRDLKILKLGGNITIVAALQRIWPIGDPGLFRAALTCRIKFYMSVAISLPGESSIAFFLRNPDSPCQILVLCHSSRNLVLNFADLDIRPPAVEKTQAGEANPRAPASSWYETMSVSAESRARVSAEEA